MKIKLKRPVVVKGFPGVAVGDVFEVPDHFGLDLCAEGLAEPAVVVEAIEAREPEIEHRDPEPAKIRRARKTPP